MTNNDIMKKLRVALQLRDDDIISILKLVDFNVTKSELGAIFRQEDHPNYKPCGDQLLRNFLNGLVIHLRGPQAPAKPAVPKQNSGPSAGAPRGDKNFGPRNDRNRDQERGSRDRREDNRPPRGKR
ncbi:DUF1456 family protein [Rufibacter immobilis]|uniref:DUF1456 family protein n=1 Tax=Rufibacter immobilis TaxID=1348778 RepID=A0A3M9N2A6_9BACT|nr:DUF1456 family protein [Rufibacter immobilis]RNI31931.1 DUF1456 family protein [Rufibacter immobilis]